MVNSKKRNKNKGMLKKTIGGNVEVFKQVQVRIAVLSQNSVSQKSHFIISFLFNNLLNYFAIRCSK